jgi:hypothetical protein
MDPATVQEPRSLIAEHPAIRPLSDYHLEDFR